MRNLADVRHYLLLLCAFALAACQSANPLSAAETVEQRAYAGYGTYVIFAEKAADLAERPEISNSVKLRLIRAEEAASPVADSVLETVLEVEDIRDEIANSGTGQARLEAALVNLNSYVTRLTPLINELVRQVKGAE